MPVETLTYGLKTVAAEYDFAVDGGAVSQITLRTASGINLGNNIESGSIVLGGYVEVLTVPTSGGSATISVDVEGAGDTVASAAISGAPWSTTGRKSVIPAFTGATTLKTTAKRSVKITVGTAALTAGKLRVVLFYI